MALPSVRSAARLAAAIASRSSSASAAIEAMRLAIGPALRCISSLRASERLVCLLGGNISHSGDLGEIGVFPAFWLLVGNFFFFGGIFEVFEVFKEPMRPVSDPLAS